MLHSETVVEHGNVVRLSVYRDRRGKVVTVAKRKLPRKSWLRIMRKAFKHCLIAMRLKFGQVASRARVSKRPN